MACTLNDDSTRRSILFEAMSIQETKQLQYSRPVPAVEVIISMDGHSSSVLFTESVHQNLVKRCELFEGRANFV